MPFGVYVHVPFCQTRCGYCDFNTYTAGELGRRRQPRAPTPTPCWARCASPRDVLGGDALGDRSRRCRRSSSAAARPTLLPAEHLGVVIDEIADRFGLADDVEITTEANPETVTPGYLAKLREVGFTRLSVGMQSAVPQGAGGARPPAPPRATGAGGRRGARRRLRARQPGPDLRRAARDRRRLAALAGRRGGGRPRPRQRLRAGRRAGHGARPAGRLGASCRPPTTTCRPTGT